MHGIFYSNEKEKWENRRKKILEINCVIKVCDSYSTNFDGFYSFYIVPIKNNKKREEKRVKGKDKNVK